MMKKALILGSFDESKDAKDSTKFVLTKSAVGFDQTSNGALQKLINKVGPVKKGKSRIFYGVNDAYDFLSVVGLGPMNAGFNENEELEEKRENIRAGVAAGLRAIREAAGAPVEVDVDDCSDAEAAAEGVFLAKFYFDELKGENYKKKLVKINLLNGDNESKEKWRLGEIKANGQNVVRRLTEMPANLMTPTIFVEQARKLSEQHGFKLVVHDKKWAEEKKMGSFLSVAKGSDEPPFFLEMHYNNAPDTKPVVFVGKGICFDSGGYSLKPPKAMESMKMDMSGAACVLMTVSTLAALKAKVNIVGLTPLCENLVNGHANKPGDVVIAMNGKSIQIDNTDAEGRLILADGLCYAHTFNPELILDIATLTGSMKVALGSSATGVYSTSKKYFDLLHKSGTITGDRVWRLPLFNHFTKQITDTQCADLNNIGSHSPNGGCCVAAAFLKEFVTHENWMHLDIAGVADTRDEVPYISKGMSGRPLRTLVQFVESIFSKK